MSWTPDFRKNTPKAATIQNKGKRIKLNPKISKKSGSNWLIQLFLIAFNTRSGTLIGPGPSNNFEKIAESLESDSIIKL